jgi:hypothetical protein
MSGPHKIESDTCVVRWCDEQLDHDGPHRRYLLSGHGVDVDTGHAAVIGVTLEGESARTSGLVLSTEARQLGLPWALAQQLGGIVASAVRRYAR